MLKEAACPGREYCFLQFYLNNDYVGGPQNTLFLTNFKDAKGLQQTNITFEVIMKLIPIRI